MRIPFLPLLLLAACATAGGPAADHPAPSQVYDDLFAAVALSGVMEPKDWADATPLRDPDAIVEDWEDEGAPTDTATLRVFVAANFAPPAAVAAPPTLPPDRTLAQHVDLLWPILTRPGTGGTQGSLLPLPNPYLVPGGRFREAYYWDAYFTLLGLDDRALREGMVANFEAELAQYGRIPNGNRTYYLGRSQPPVLYLMVALLNEADPAAAWAAHLEALRAEHAFWMAGADDLDEGEARARAVRLGDGSLLSRYWDDRAAPRDESYLYDVETASRSGRAPEAVYRDLRAGAESGWDFSSRWLDEPADLSTIQTTNIVPADLNALLYGLEQAIAAGCARAGEAGCASAYASAAEARSAAMRRHLWSSDGGYFADYDLRTGAVRDRPTAAMLYPLFTGLATQAEADRTARSVRRHLLAPGGVLPTPVETGEQWDAPNGWAPHQWIAAAGLSAYGHDTLAEEIEAGWARTVARGFCESGRLVEKYDLETARDGGGGEYPTQDGFGWTNGVTIRMIEDEPALAPLGEVRILRDPAACAAAVRL
ncbi:alpha,alpha-trehalase TreF [Parvularcula dongshanensis]|uniref:Alpha,alpha-trehalase n=1 Tax=Parvularcula dongshanensis TaxID=1173995 RepID=A0A840I0P1_9PROT|nr:alpha,alpha-trehalase TreF [Parvularcula dongshanensis]MBB4657772.1 alpha,alpha-trehalase [Parvularcula dongshanensis]